MPVDQTGETNEMLCIAIRQAMSVADGQGNTLIAALLAEALDAADCDAGKYE